MTNARRKNYELRCRRSYDVDSGDSKNSVHDKLSNHRPTCVSSFKTAIDDWIRFSKEVSRILVKEELHRRSIEEVLERDQQRAHGYLGLADDHPTKVEFIRTANKVARAHKRNLKKVADLESVYIRRQQELNQLLFYSELAKVPLSNSHNEVNDKLAIWKAVENYLFRRKQNDMAHKAREIRKSMTYALNRMNVPRKNSNTIEQYMGESC